MLKSDVLKYFGTQEECARRIGYTQPAVALWPDVVPEAAANRISRLTMGKERNGIKLVFDLKFYMNREFGSYHDKVTEST